MKRLELLVLSIILIGAFTVRLYRLNNPIADWHSWRQADTSAVSRNFVKYGFDLLHPKYDDISNVQTGVDNPQGYRFLEFPLYNVFQAGGFILFDHFTLEEWGRLITIIVSLITVAFIYLLGKRYANMTAGIIAALFFAFIPYSIYYGRTILPDPSMVMAILGGIYFFGKWLDETKRKKIDRYRYWRTYFIAVFFTACALLFKPYAVFFALPFLYLSWTHYKWDMFRQRDLWLFLVFSLYPLLWWRIWMLRYPEGIAMSSWLFNGGNIRFTGAFFRWIFQVRIGRLILGSWGLPIVLLGLFKREKHDMLFFYSLILSALLYLTIIARGNVQHDYYQILIIPAIAFLFGLGGDFLLKSAFKLPANRIIGIGIFSMCVIFMWSFAWYQVRDYFNINNPAIVTAGHAVDRLTPKNALIIAPLDGDTSFLYQTNRKGWPSFEHSTADLVKLGADYLVLANPKQADYDIGKTYRIVSATKDYILFDLHEKP